MINSLRMIFSLFRIIAQPACRDRQRAHPRQEAARTPSSPARSARLQDNGTIRVQALDRRGLSKFTHFPAGAASTVLAFIGRHRADVFIDRQWG